MATPQSQTYRFADYRLDAVTRELWAPDGTAIPLTAKAFDVLLYLIDHRDRVASKDELLAAVWPGRVVEENNLTQAISALRRALGTGAGDHRYIVTLPGRGYRFVATLNDDAQMQAPEGADAPQPTAPQWLPQRRWWGAAAAAVALSALLVWVIASRERMVRAVGTDGTQAITLAVLPFRPIGSERDEMLDLGMAETVIARLSRSTTLRVLSLGSVQTYTGKTVDPLRAGATLGADFVIDGSTQWRGDSIRVNARLLSLPDGGTVWAGTFDESPDQVFTVQDALAKAVSSALSLEYAAQGHRSPCDGENAQAYRAYLRGRYLFNRPDTPRLLQALAAFDEAIKHDPTCARALAGSAFTRRALVMVGDRDPREQFPLSYAEIDRALAIDPQSAEAYLAKGFNQFWYDWDWAGAEASLRHSLTLNPNLAETHYALAHLLNNIGRHQEARVYAQQAMVLDPLSPLVNVLAAGFIGNAGNVEEARLRLEEVLKLEPDFWLALLFRGGMMFGQGDRASGIATMERAVELSGRNSQTLSRLASVYAQSGKRTAAVRILAELQARGRTGYVPATTLATIHIALGDEQQALEMLERGYAERDIGMTFLRSWYSLEGRPRYDALMQRMRLLDSKEPQVPGSPDDTWR